MNKEESEKILEIIKNIEINLRNMPECEEYIMNLDEKIDNLNKKVDEIIHLLASKKEIE